MTMHDVKTLEGLYLVHDNLDFSGEKFTLRHWDGMDGSWLDILPNVSKEEVLRAWYEKTEEGTKMLSFKEIDYYRIFPADTTMLWSAEEGREMFRDE